MANAARVVALLEKPMNVKWFSGAEPLEGAVEGERHQLVLENSHLNRAQAGVTEDTELNHSGHGAQPQWARIKAVRSGDFIGVLSVKSVGKVLALKC